MHPGVRARRSQALLLAIVTSATLSPPAAAEREHCPAEPLYFQLQPAYGLQRLAAARAGDFKVHQRLGPDRLVPPIAWADDRYGNEDWRSSLHSLEWLDPLFNLDAVPALRLDPAARDLARPDGPRIALARARDIVLDWIAANPPGGPGVDERAWGNKITAERAGYIAYALRAGRCAGILDEAATRELRSSLALHARYLTAERGSGNHGLFVDYGLAVIARQAPFLERAKLLGRLAERRFRRLLDERLDSGDALWREHSPTYQFLVLRLLNKMARLTGDADLAALARRMERSAPWLLNPSGRLLQLGDSYASRVPPRVRSRGTRVDGARAFFDSGFAAIRDPEQGDLLALAAGYFNRWHKHADELSFELFAAGTHVVADTGRVGKRLPGDYAGSATAHSTLTVDGVDFADRPGRFYGSALDAIGKGDGWHALLAHNPRLRPQEVRHSRLLLYRPGVALIVVDQLESDAPHVYRRFLQLGPAIAVERTGTGLGLSTPEGFAGRLSDAPAGEEVTLDAVRGQQDPPAGLLFPGFGQAVPRWMVGLRSEAADAVYVLTIGLDGADGTTAALDDPDRGDAVLVDTPGRPLERLSVERRGRELRVRTRAPG